MTISKRLAALRATAPVAATPLPGIETDTDEIEDDETLESKPAKDKDMTTEEMNAATAAARKEGFDAATARFNTVIGSANFAGRETLAKTLLATDLSAEQIETALAATAPAAAPAAPAAAASDDAARAEMAAAIAANSNSGIEVGESELPAETDAKAVAAGFAKGADFANQMNGFPA